MIQLDVFNKTHTLLFSTRLVYLHWETVEVGTRSRTSVKNAASAHCSQETRCVRARCQHHTGVGHCDKVGWNLVRYITMPL